MEELIGRRYELAELKRRATSASSEFIAIYGRRRVGKTFLVRKAFEQKFAFYATGMANASLAQQLANFQLSLKKADRSGRIQVPAKNWFEAFHQLADILESRRGGKTKQVIFLDELPWMDTLKSGFLSALEHFWNSWASSRTDILLIVCGSAASWMINKLIRNTGGLYHRVTCQIKLNPFTLRECEAFFKNQSAKLDRFQIIQLYMTMGGIPFYLRQVDVSLSAAQNIQRLFFDPTGILYNEFNTLYHSLFTNAEKHMDFIEALSKKGKGMTREELITALKLSSGGSTTRILNELEASGFIRKYVAFGKKERNSLYQLTDLYSFFFLRFIKKLTPGEDYNWLNNLDHPRQRTWAGYAFEQVCLAHIQEIKTALGIGSVLTSVSSWTGSSDKGKAQIDLIIDRRDGVINLCEMKFSINLFTIDKKYAEELRSKIGLFQNDTKTNKAIFLTFITSFGLIQNMHANSVVQNHITMDALFTETQNLLQ